ncbi:hypothetical protein BGW39_000673 [Mortierella sp. 14UC]|nr:hypothetical protein BGW39_000673 [Mortierella sp. 14UC]
MTAMLTVDARIDSFTQKTRSWPHSDDFKATPSSVSKREQFAYYTSADNWGTCQNEGLAEAGFYWKPYPTSLDNVVCFLCGKSLDDWNKDDDPFEEHLSHSRNCSWAIVKSICPVEDGLPFRWDDDDNLPKGERMTKARLQTFGKWWPHEKTKGWFGTTKRMANAGFIYAPVEDSDDNVQCPYCETALDGWEMQDDPVHEHQRRRPNCPFFATRASAPTKASAAKASKSKRKTADATAEDTLSVKDEAHGSTAEKPSIKKSAKSNRSQKSTAVDSISSRSSSHAGTPSTGRNVDFDLPDNSSISSEKTSKSGTNRQSVDSAKDSSQAQDIKVKTEEQEQSASAVLAQKSTKSRGSTKSTTSTKSTSSSKSMASNKSTGSAKSAGNAKSAEGSGSSIPASTPSSHLPAKSSQLERKRQQPGDKDMEDATSMAEESRFSYLKKASKRNEIRIVLRKRQKIGTDEQGEDPETWGNMSDLESEVHENTFTTRNVDNMDGLAAELFPEVEAPGASGEVLSSAGPSTESTKKKRARAKPIKVEYDDEAEYGRRKKKTTSAKATKRTAKSISTSSAKKRATKPLIEIFEQPDDNVESVNAGVEQVATTANTQGAEGDKHVTEADQREAVTSHQEVLAGPSTASVPMESSSAPETIPANTTTVQPSDEDAQDAGDTEDAQVPARDVIPSTPPPAYASPLPRAPSPPPVVESPPKTPIRGQGSGASFHKSQNTTPMPLATVRRQAVTFEDIEDANVVVVDPSTPVRRAASRTDIEGWEDEDRRDSNQSALTSPFISPSQWHLDAGIMTSTPNAKRTPAQPFRGITPRQKRIKDVIGMAHLKSPLRSSYVDRLGRSSQLVSPSPKKAARSEEIPPEMKQSMLIDRFETLMQENASSKVMAVAGQALQEGAKDLRRSQNKERRQAAAEATAASISKHKEIAERKEADAFFEDNVRLQEFAEADAEEEEDADINFMRTPVKKTARVLFESTTPTTPIKTPSAMNMSLVISAIGAASRRNNSAAAMSPFVRTPVKKTKDLRLEGLHIDADYLPTGPSTQAQAQAPLAPIQPPSQPQPQPQPAPSPVVAPIVQPGAHQVKAVVSNVAATIAQGSVADVSIAREATGSELGAKAVPSLRKDLLHQQQQQQQQPQQQQQQPQQQQQRGVGTITGAGDTKGRRLHPDPEEHRRRTRLLEEASFSESQLKMTVEEFHRACVAEQVLALEVAAEAWVQRFEEESNRVRRALMEEDGM